MSRLISLLALLLAIISIALNVVLGARLNQARVGVLLMLDEVSRSLDTLPDVSFRQTVHVKQAVAVAGELPLNQDFTVPISTSFPISTTAHVNVATPLGLVDVPVAINTSVPVNLQVPVTLSRTVPYSLTVPLDLEVPIEIHLREVGIEGGIKQVRDEIQRLRDSLQ
jgi:hypothetical protein